ncbi:MAG: hypothetical protein AAB795_02740, partial [Patescibacteria group bacterium]
FVEGMGYVALSRVRSLDGLKLLGINRMALAVHPEVLKIDGMLKEYSDMAISMLKNNLIEEIKKSQATFLKNNKPQKKYNAEMEE